MATLHGGHYHDHNPHSGGHGSDNIGHQDGNSGSNAQDMLFAGGTHYAAAASLSADISHTSSSSDIIDGSAHSAAAGVEASQGHELAAVASSHDTFVFSGGGGQAVVLDASQGDVLVQIAHNINGLDIQSAADVAARVTNVNGSAVVDLGHGDTLTLHGVTADEVHHDPSAFFTIH
jgi:hypothetical protein